MAQVDATRPQKASEPADLRAALDHAQTVYVQLRERAIRLYHELGVSDDLLSHYLDALQDNHNQVVDQIRRNYAQSQRGGGR